MKIFNLFFALIICTSIGRSQTLRNQPINVTMDAAQNTIAEVFDAAYIPALNKYVIVGNFRYVNGALRNRVAFLNSDGTLSNNPTGFTINTNLTNIDGDIHCVEVYQNNIFLGGEFANINGTASPGLRKFLYNSGTSSYSIDPWIPLTQNGSVVYDMVPNGGGTRIALVGIFDELVNGTGTTYERINVAEINSGSSTVTSSFGSFYLYYDMSPYSNPVPIKPHINCYNNKYYITGSELNYNSFSYDYSVIRTSITGVFEKGFEDNTGSADFGQNIAFFADSIMLVEENWNMSCRLRVFYPGNFGTITDQYVYNQSGTQLNPTNDGYGLRGDGEDGIYLVSDLNNNGTYRLQHLRYSGTQTFPTNSHRFDEDTAFVLNVNTTYFDPNNSEHLHIANDRLFVSSSILTGTPGLNSKGVLMYCLPPYDSQGINNNYNAALGMDPFGNIIYPPKNVDSIVCPGNVRGYAIKPVNLATGYQYYVSGDNIEYGFSTAFNTPATVFTPVPANGFIPPQYTSSSNFVNQIWLRFGDGFTGGSVTVYPFTTCNSLTDFQYSKPSTTNFTLAPVPNIQVPTEIAFNCLVSDTTMTITSSTPGVSYTWYEVDGDINNTANYTINSSVAPPSDTLYILASVTETAGNQCRATDSVKIYRNTVAPELIPLTTGLLWNCYSDTLYFEIADTNTSYNDVAVFESGMVSGGPYTGTNPAVIDHAGTIYFTATYPSNGCTSYFSEIISTDTLSPEVHVNGAIGLIYDTLNCINNSVTMNLGSNDAGVQPYWFYENDSIPVTLTVDQDDPYYTIADTTTAEYVTVSYFYGAFDPNNGCSTANPGTVAVIFDIKSPAFIPYAGDSIFNCSQDSLVLVHDEVLNVVTQGWITEDGNALNDTLISQSVFNDGVHVYQIIADNGCNAYDTVNVDRTSELTFDPVADFWVCPEEPFTVSATANGQGPFTYTWEGGQTGTQFSGIGGTNTLLVVTASNGTCSGIDTILAQITPPIVATFIGYQECGNNASIQVDTVYGGAANNVTQYTYSFNNGPFTSTNYFPVDSFAAYPLAIMDTLGCVYEFQTVIEGELQTPTCDFLASTYNVSGDTVFIVDVTLFQGFDGVIWSSNANVEFIDASNNNTMITTTDTGWVEILYTGYIYDTVSVSPLDVDTCTYPFSKWIYFGEFGAQLDTTEVINGINNPSVYPNPTIDGNATITVTFELGVEQEYYIFTTNSLGADIPILSAHDTGSGIREHEFTLPNLSAGTYLIHILSSYGARQLKLVVQ